MSFEFLKSNRFWALIIGAVSIYLQSKGYIGEPEMLLISTIMGGHIIVRSVDRATEVLSEGKPLVPPDSR